MYRGWGIYVQRLGDLCTETRGSMYRGCSSYSAGISSPCVLPHPLYLTFYLHTFSIFTPPHPPSDPLQHHPHYTTDVHSHPGLDHPGHAQHQCLLHQLVRSSGQQPPWDGPVCAGDVSGTQSGFHYRRAPPERRGCGWHPSGQFHRAVVPNSWQHCTECKRLCHIFAM